MRKQNIKNYLLTSLVSLSSLLFAQIANAGSDIIGHWSKLPTSKNTPTSEDFWNGRGCPGVDYERGIIFLYRYDDGELWKYSIQDNVFTQIAKFPDTRYDCIYNPSENTIWFTTIGRGETYRLPVTGGDLEYIGGSGTHWDNFSPVSYWDSCRDKYSFLFGYGGFSVKNWCWQFGIGDTDWKQTQENRAGREPWQRGGAYLAEDVKGKRIFVGMGGGNSTGNQYYVDPGFTPTTDSFGSESFDYLRDLWCLHLEDNTWENLIPLNEIAPLGGRLV